MKPYLITTGLLFGVLTVLHVWRAIAEWPQTAPSPLFLLAMGALVFVPGALSCWAWRLLRNLPPDPTAPEKEKTPANGPRDPAA